MSKNTLDTSSASGDQDTIHNTITVAQADGARSEHALRKIGLLANREFKSRITQRSYKITLIIISLAILIGTCIPTIIAFFAKGSGSAQTNLTLVNNAGSIANLDNTALNQYFTRSLNGTSSSSSHFTVHIASAGDINRLKAQVKSGNVDILLVVDRDATRNLHVTYYTQSASSSSTTPPQVQGVVNQLSILDKSSQLGLSAAQTQSLFTPPAFTIVSTQAASTKNDIAQRLTGYIIGIAGMLLLFTAIIQYGTGVATGVAEEKGTRIMEILVNAASPFQLMTSKILGIGAAGLLQMFVQVIVGILGMLIQNPLSKLLGVSALSISLTLNATTIMVLVLLLVYFILGFLLYAAIYAAVGALLQRVDEVQSATSPITMLLMVGYIASFIGGSLLLANPQAPTWFSVMSLIPFFTPTMMMVRVGAGAAPTWEIGLSIILLAATTLLCIWIAGRIYRFGILMYGQKPKLGQIIKIVRQ
ncbi:ABC transporter permease [Ktedonobacteria bacterium brp13]|nr:ABC transporter permease [Ktedonobacteria bacterium brp13]